MPLITVIKPFGLRLGSDRERQDFGVGVHFISDEEFDHWFVQACLFDGRAALAPEAVLETVEEDAEEPAVPGTEVDAAAEGVAEETAAPGADAETDADAAADENPEETVDKQATPTREELMALTVAQLKEMAAMCGVTLASNATKAVIVDAILAGQEGE